MFSIGHVKSVTGKEERGRFIWYLYIYTLMEDDFPTGHVNNFEGRRKEENSFGTSTFIFGWVAMVIEGDIFYLSCKKCYREKILSVPLHLYLDG